MPDYDRDFMLGCFQKDVDRLLAIIDREGGRLHKPSDSIAATSLEVAPPTLGPGHTLALSRMFRPPGGRHDNDHADIVDVEIVPTQSELVAEEVSDDVVVEWTLADDVSALCPVQRAWRTESHRQRRRHDQAHRHAVQVAARGVCVSSPACPLDAFTC